MPTVIALHMPSAAQNQQRAADVATNPNNAANLIGRLKLLAPVGTPMNVISAAAISGAVHASDFPPEGGTLHVDTTTGEVTPQPLGTPAPPTLSASDLSAPGFLSDMLPGNIAPSKPLLGAAAGGVGALLLTHKPLLAAVGAGVGWLAGKKLAGE